MSRAIKGDNYYLEIKINSLYIIEVLYYLKK